MENIFAICFGAIFYIGGPLLLIYGIYYLYLAIRNPGRVEETKSWPTKEARLTTMHLLGRKGMINNVDVRFEYSVDGVDYVGKNLNLYPNTIFGKTRLEDVLETYHEGQYLEVYVNPQRPKEAILETDIQDQNKYFLIWSILNVLVGGFLVAVMVYGLLGG